MTNVSVLRKTTAAHLATLTALSFFAAVTSLAQSPRIASAIDNTSRATIVGSRSPRAVLANDVGAVPASTKLQGISIVLSRTQAQQAALDALIAAQQNPASPQYQQWVTPKQFGAQFGAAASDIAAIEAWLQQEGFTIDSVSNSRDRIFFSGTADEVKSAFGAELHYFKSADGTKHFAPAADLSVPSAIASAVLAVTNLSDFKPHSHAKLPSVKPNYTSGQTGNIFLDPDDVATIYDINAAYNAGYTGTGQSIAIMGQSAVVATDITNFQTALGLTAKVPTQVLVPNTGTSAINPDVVGDEGESDLDLEYSSTIARGATIYFVYTGNSANSNGVFTSMQYAIDNDIAPIISISYGSCEIALGATEYAQLNAVLQQGAAQGQSIIASSGDSGSTGCSGTNGFTLAQQEVLAVEFPASSQYVTAMGGTEFPAADVANGNTTYWTASTGTDVVSSAKSYIPEQVWNDDAADVAAADPSPISSGGGGVSILTPRPTWQTGVPGITAGSFRLVPDISLAASPNFPGFLFCSSDTSTWNQGQTSSCSSGLRDSNTQDFTIAGGTSFDAPIFAGILALINQSRNSTGQGVVNSTLYTLASNATTYGSAFHDITSGGNQCLAGITFCSTAGASEYAATTGYDEASGLGSIDVFNLLTAWPASTTVVAGAAPTTVSLAAATTIPASGASDAITISVIPVTNTPAIIAPTGTLTLTVDGVVVSPAPTLTNGIATYTFTSTVAGSHVLVATYSGSATYAPSTSTLVLTVGGTTSSTGTVTLSATNITVSQGGSATSTITVTPGNGYAGTFEFLTIGVTSGTLSGACASGGANVTITGTASQTSSITISTNDRGCPSGAVSLMQGSTGRLANGTFVRVIAANDPADVPRKPSPLGPASSGLAAAGLLVVGIFGRRSRKLRSCVAVCLLALFGLALSGCSNSTTTSVVTPTGTSTVTLTGSDTVNTAITASTTFTVTVQ